MFDRLGPGTDEVRGRFPRVCTKYCMAILQPSPAHRGRYSSEKHSSSSGGQEKGRGHAYGPHVRMEDRETPSSRDRKAR